MSRASFMIIFCAIFRLLPLFSASPIKQPPTAVILFHGGPASELLMPRPPFVLRSHVYWSFLVVYTTCSSLEERSKSSMSACNLRSRRQVRLAYTQDEQGIFIVDPSPRKINVYNGFGYHRIDHSLLARFY